MRLSLRLAKLVNYTPDKNRRPGIIKAIVEATGLDRHLVSNLLRNVARGIPLDALSRLCEFLVDHGYCSPDQLPGACSASKRRRSGSCSPGVNVWNSAWVCGAPNSRNGRSGRGSSHPTPSWSAKC